MMDYAFLIQLVLLFSSVVGGTIVSLFIAHLAIYMMIDRYFDLMWDKIYYPKKPPYFRRPGRLKGHDYYE